MGKKNFMILGSAHNQKEIQEKISQKCKAIFLSPVFNVKKSKNYMVDLNFIKMHGLGNDFVIIDRRKTFLKINKQHLTTNKRE